MYAVNEEKKEKGNRNPYELIIPKNLYIIGTMNTADRSVGHIDYAVRRRFVFVPVLPDEKVIERYYEDDKLKKCALKLYSCVEKLFKNDGQERALSPEFYPDDVQVGHTYFLAKSKDELINKFIYQVYPLLREYYKDGVLIKNNEELKIPDTGITIDPPMDTEKIKELIEKFKECEEESSERNAEDIITEETT
jgi:5-methylcytosine-specific restriction endonuclease McrBC GTP-binding regulatory subunit McrB